MVKESVPVGTRDRLIAAMVDALRNRGYHGVGISDLLAAAQTPKGVLYHHFPGGKSELAVKAIESVAEQLGGALEKIIQRADDPVQAMSLWMSAAQKLLEKSNFHSGCPLATIALESTGEDKEIRGALNNAFVLLRFKISQVLGAMGMSDHSARATASLIVSAYEGALLQSRVAQNVDIMRETSDALIGLIRANLVKPQVAGSRK
jgi:TetR/AcrR family transcriptional regulator, lmrAB and yxaGH operons repressor